MSELHYMPLLNVEYFKSLNSLANSEVENGLLSSMLNMNEVKRKLLKKSLLL